MNSSYYCHDENNYYAGPGRPSFADIVSKELENERRKCVSDVTNQRNRRNGIEATENDTGRFINQLTDQKSLMTDRQKNPNCTDFANVVESECAEYYDYYGYSDSDDSFIGTVIPPPAFRSIEKILQRNRLRPTVTPIINPPPRPCRGRYVHGKYNHQHLRSTPNFVAHGFSDDSVKGCHSPKRQRSQTVRIMPKHRMRGHLETTGHNENENCSKLSSKETKTAHCGDGLTDDKVRALVKENLSLSRELQELKEQMKGLEEEKVQGRARLLDAMAEKHQRRVLLIKEEFDYRFAIEKEKFENDAVKVSQRQGEMALHIKELEQKIVGLEASEKLAQARIGDEKRRLEEETKHTGALREQISASLSTVAQFSEKNLQLMKEMENLRAQLESSEQVEKQLLEMQTKHEQLSCDCNSLSQKLIQKDEELEKVRSEGTGKEEEICRLSEEISKREIFADREEAEKKLLQSRCSKLETELFDLKSEAIVLRQRHDECLEIARSSWEEVHAVKQEAVVLRQQLMQREMTMEKLKEFAKGHQRSLSSNVAEMKNRELMKTHESQGGLHGQLSTKNENSIGVPKAPTFEIGVPSCLTFAPLSIGEATGRRIQTLTNSDEVKSSTYQDDYLHLPPHILTWYSQRVSQLPSKNHKHQAASQVPADPFMSVAKIFYCNTDDHKQSDVVKQQTSYDNIDQGNMGVCLSPIRSKQGQCYHSSPILERSVSNIRLEDSECKEVQTDASISHVAIKLGTPTTPTTASATPTTASATPTAGFDLTTLTTLSSSSSFRENQHCEFPIHWNHCHGDTIAGGEGVDNSNNVLHSSPSFSSTPPSSAATRLVKVLLSNGKCRYELQTLDTATFHC